MPDNPTKCVICQSAPRYQYKHIKFVLCAQCTLDHILRVTEAIENGEIKLPISQLAENESSSDQTTQEKP